MRYAVALKWLIPPIFLLSLFAAGIGLFDQSAGNPYPYTNHRGETVTINGSGLYYYDTVSSAAQTQANDLITLVVGLPALAVSSLLALRGSLRARLVLAGTLGFFLYTYLSMSMRSSYNALFLVYVALFGLSLYAFVLSMMSFDFAELPVRFSRHLPRRWLAGLMFFAGCFLLVAWLGRIVPPLLAGRDPVLENTTTLVIQAMDLSLIVPLAFLAGILLLRRSPWGYLLASVALFKGVTLGLAVSAMAINMSAKGVPESPFVAVPFFAMAVMNIVMAVLLLRSVEPHTEKALAA